uniref:FH2 domain-containing protein n=1 Tax=Strigamia maritima TaxID=126957 RepID=T1IIN0_STRMM
MQRWKEAAGRIRQQSENDLLSTKRKTSEPIDHWDPELCIRLLRAPTVHNYSSIRRRLETCSRTWMREFLEQDGLGVLFESLTRLDLRGFDLASITLQHECVRCIKVVMNSKIGLDCIVESHEYTRKLVFAQDCFNALPRIANDAPNAHRARRLTTLIRGSTQKPTQFIFHEGETLDTRNMAVKKQVFELLSALCIYSDKGHQLVIDALHRYKIFKGYRYQFTLVLEELKNAQVVPYKVTVLGFINCLIICNEDLHHRLRLRNEFIVLGLSQILDSFRMEDDDELLIQCQAFDENRHKDEDSAEAMGIDVHGHHFDLFQSIFDKVRVMGGKCPSCLLNIFSCFRSTPSDSTDMTNEATQTVQTRELDTASNSDDDKNDVHDSSLALPFLLLLQNLSQLDPNNPESDQVWDLLEKVSARAANGGLAHLQKGLNFQVLVLNTRDESTQTPKTRRAFRKEMSPERTANAQTQTDIILTRDKKNSRRRVSPMRGLSSDSGEELFFDSYDSLPEIEDVEHLLARPFNDAGKFKARPFPHSSLPPSPKESPLLLPPPPPPLPDFGSSIPPPPPFPFLDSLPLPPPPPPPPHSALSSCLSAPPPPPLPSSDFPPPLSPIDDPDGPMPFQRPNYAAFNAFSPSTANALARASPYATLPRPRQKMKTLNWTKVPNQVIGDSVWKSVHTKVNPNIQLDYDKVEELFCQKKAAEKAAASTDVKKKEHTEVTLVDPKRSLNINIFLKQFKCPIEELVNLVKNGNSDKIGAERLRAFQRVLPEREEIELVKSFRGDGTRLGLAEKFIVQLGSLDSYALRVEAMLQREEFEPSVDALRVQLEAILTTGNDLLNNKSLKEFLALVLHTGNFLNAGSYAGNAVGFKLNTLSKLYETRANKPRVTLLHFLVEVAERENANMLDFTTDMKSLSQAAKISITGSTSEITQLKNTFNKLEKQVGNAQDDVKQQFDHFISKSRDQVTQLENQMKSINEMSTKLARHFCEDESKFKLEDCLSTFAGFCEKVKQARIENEQRKKQEERAAKLCEQRAFAKDHKPIQRESSQFLPDEICLVDKLLNEIRRGSFKLKKTPLCN